MNGWGAIIIGIVAGIIPWMSMNWFQKTGFMMKVDDTLSVFSTHGVAGLTGGLLVGVLASPDMLEYIGTDKEAPGVSVTGLLYGDTGHQLLMQVYGAAFIIVYNVITTAIILKVISIIVPLRMDEATLRVGDDAVHGETAYAIGVGGRVDQPFGGGRLPAPKRSRVSFPGSCLSQHRRRPPRPSCRHQDARGRSR